MQEAVAAKLPEEPRRTRGRPRLEDVAVIESNLLDVARREFIAHGYGGTSMRQIVKAAGISRTTLYSRYASKEALFRAIMQHQIERLSAYTSLTTANGQPALEEGLKSYAERSLAISFEGDLLAVNRLIHSESQRFPELGIAAAERTRLGISQIAWFIAQCAEADGIPCRDPDAVAEIFILALRGWYVDAMLSNRAVGADEIGQWSGRVVAALIAGRRNW